MNTGIVTRSPLDPALASLPILAPGEDWHLPVARIRRITGRHPRSTPA